ncbi:uncharacterized protein LOC123298343 [Chrysoperla carnea]|uniref:uncharacterized protein LOC123298343 n=1 Tax=Chrysoperla carnea TaxID=189513 RepID=UPI001D096CBE|nr:uncharacterized protein LOC123298343 [Chrysoperla carnea]
MPHQYKHKDWERYFPKVPVVTWIKTQNLRKFKSWTYTGLAWTVLLGTTTLYLTDWNPIAKFLPSKKKTEINTDNIDPSNTSLYQKVAYGCGFYKFIRPSCKTKTDEPKKKKSVESSSDDVEYAVEATEETASKVTGQKIIDTEVASKEDDGKKKKKKSKFFRTENETNIDQLLIIDTKIPPNMVEKGFEGDIPSNEDSSTDNELFEKLPENIDPFLLTDTKTPPSRVTKGFEGDISLKEDNSTDK